MTWRCMCGHSNYQQFLYCARCGSQAPTAAVTIARTAADMLKPEPPHPWPKRFYEQAPHHG